MMNTKRVIQTKVQKLWDFPPLSDGKQGRAITKHFTNLSYILNPNHYALLNYLIYQSAADNTIIYSTKLLKQYQRSVKVAGEYYNQETNLHRSVPRIAGNFEWLIQNSLLLPVGYDKKFLINPCLTFSKVYVKAEFYKKWVLEYQEHKRIGLMGTNRPIIDYIDHVDKNFKRRGKRL
jgi:hypothetical protein